MMSFAKKTSVSIKHNRLSDDKIICDQSRHLKAAFITIMSRLIIWGTFICLMQLLNTLSDLASFLILIKKTKYNCNAVLFTKVIFHCLYELNMNIFLSTSTSHSHFCVLCPSLTGQRWTGGWTMATPQ